MIKHSEEFRQEAVRIALTSGLPRCFSFPRRLSRALRASKTGGSCLLPCR